MTRGILTATMVLVLLLVTPAGAVGTTETVDMVTLTITVEDQDGDPVRNAELTATWENGSNTEVTASNGKAFLDVPKGANVTISLSHPDYIRNDPYAVTNASEQSVTVPVYQRGQLTVTVADEAGPVADANVILRKDGRIAATGRTNESGVFVSGDIERGQYSVAVVKPGYYRNMTMERVDESAETRVVIDRGTVTLTVAVRDPHFSPPRPLTNATVEIESIGQIQTLANGQASVTVPVNTEFSVTVSKNGYDTVTETVRVQESDRRVNSSISRTPSLTVNPLNRRVVTNESVVVEVTDEYDKPVEGATVLLDDDPVGTTDDEGRVSVPIEDPGNHTVVAATNGLRSSSVTIEAISGEDETPTPTATATPTVTATESPTPPETTVGTPGFTVIAALLALGIGIARLARRRD